MQDNISEFLGAYGINHSAYMVLTTLFAAENHCLSPSEISQKLQFTRTNITRITDFLEKAGYVKGRIAGRIAVLKKSVWHLKVCFLFRGSLLHKACIWKKSGIIWLMMNRNCLKSLIKNYWHIFLMPAHKVRNIWGCWIASGKRIMILADVFFRIQKQK